MLAVLSAVFFAATPAARAATQPLLHVQTSDLRASLEGELRAELSAERLTADRQKADLIVGLERVDENLELEMREPSGRLVLHRTIGLESGLAPALRVAVLAVVEAAKRSEVQVNLQNETPPPIASPIAAPAPIVPEEPGPPRLWIGAGSSLITFGSPGTALLGLVFSASYEVFGGAIGARAEYHGRWRSLVREGRLFQDLATSDVLTGEPTGGAAFLVLELPVLSLDRFEARLEAAGGARWLHLEARGGWDSAPLQSGEQQLVAAGRLGAGVLARLVGPLRLQLSAGAEVRSGAPYVVDFAPSIPAELGSGYEPFESARLVPWVELQLQAGLF